MTRIEELINIGKLWIFLIKTKPFLCQKCLIIVNYYISIKKNMSDVTGTVKPHSDWHTASESTS